MAVYPSNIPTTSDLPDAGADLSTNPHSALHDDVRDEVIAIAGELGVSPSGTASTVRERMDDGLGLRSIVYFTSNGTFTKATYPWLRAVRVRVQGGGGGGAGSGSDLRGAGGGAGGTYAESFILVASLASSETVTVGGGGTAGAAGNNGGGAGGASSFGSLVSANGGGGGTPPSGGSVGGAPSTTATGDLIFVGQAGFGANGLDRGPSGAGGSSHLGGGGRNIVPLFVGTQAPGGAGGQYGGGGAGGYRVSANAAGGAGAQGIVIVELYA